MNLSQYLQKRHLHTDITTPLFLDIFTFVFSFFIFRFVKCTRQNYSKKTNKKRHQSKLVVYLVLLLPSYPILFLYSCEFMVHRQLLSLSSHFLQNEKRMHYSPFVCLTWEILLFSSLLVQRWLWHFNKILFRTSHSFDDVKIIESERERETLLGTHIMRKIFSWFRVRKPEFGYLRRQKNVVIFFFSFFRFFGIPVPVWGLAPTKQVILPI